MQNDTDWNEKFYKLKEQVDYLYRLQSAEAVSWTDYSGGSTVTGWSSTTTKLIFYKRTGKLIFVQARIVGTSDSTTTSLTLPYVHQGGIRLRVPVQAIDNGGAYAWGVADLPSASDVLTFHPTPAMGSWTASGTKEINLAFWYEAV